MADTTLSKSPPSKHTSLETPVENGDSISITSRDYQPHQLTSGISSVNANSKTTKKTRFDNAVRIVKTKQFQKVVASCFQAGCAGWNGESDLAPLSVIPALITDSEPSCY